MKMTRFGNNFAILIMPFIPIITVKKTKKDIEINGVAVSKKDMDFDEAIEWIEIHAQRHLEDVVALLAATIKREDK